MLTRSTTHPRRQLLGKVGFVLPLLVLIFVCFDLPMVGMLTRSFGLPQQPGLQNYAELLSTTLYARVLLNTIEIALAATVGCILLGYPLSYWILGLSARGRLIALALVIVPFWVSVLIRTYAWIILLGYSGVINSVLLALGWVDAPVSFLFNAFGVSLGVANVLLPFFVLPLFASMLRIDPRLVSASRSLGASEWTTFWRVFFPLTVPAVIAGGLLVFLMSLGFYVTPMILGGGRVPMVVNMLDVLVNGMPNWGLACAIAMVLLVMTLALYALSRRIGTRSEAR